MYRFSAAAAAILSLGLGSSTASAAAPDDPFTFEGRRGKYRRHSKASKKVHFTSGSGDGLFRKDGHDLQRKVIAAARRQYRGEKRREQFLSGLAGYHPLHGGKPIPWMQKAAGLPPIVKAQGE